MIRPSAVLATIGAIALLVLPTACSDRGPAGPDAGLGQVQINASTNSPTVSDLVIEVTAADLSDPYVFNFAFADGVAAGTIAVPAGGQRTITVRAYDVSGIQTHEGVATLNILPGANPTVHITLRPLNGQQPIEIALGSFTVAVAPAAATVAVGQTLQLTATVTDVDGTVVGGTPDVVWATDAPAVAAVDAAGLMTGHVEGSARIVASFGGVAAAALVTVLPSIAFVSDRDANQEIYVSNPDGSGATNLTNNTANDNAFQWSPDGSQITFVSDRDGNTEVYVMSADGSGQVNLSNDGQGDFQPQWSPDGSKIAFSSWRFGVSDVFVVNADGTGLSDLTNDNGAFDGNGQWSPDGSKIAFRSDRDGNQEIYVMNADGSVVVNLTGNAARDDYPLWSPDGSKIAFVSDRDGDLDVYVMNADGTGQTDLSNSSAADSLPQWSPDGSKIAFVSSRDGNQEVYVVNADGSGLARLTNNTAFDDTPRWSPGGTKLAFVSDRDGNQEIYVMNADGSGPTNLTGNTAQDGDPRWMPTP